ncbi:DUF5675 family protein [Orenia marismortui]|uniref:DUF5675 domain-containing protein n=1 Tax=Orenia marismortui TaxID=46469 RepID=A0A4V6QB98_9FIRM|nr:DUF5675 family protein [Orenia marismortui]TDX52130.1 hypothetical protein C7959_10852 [Orenia marismortui]
MNEIRVIRKEESEESILGEIYVDGEKVGYTLERTWKNNLPNESCIPPGEYKAFIKKKETSRWSYDVIQLEDVFKRTAIQIHVGNYPDDTQGCILVGKGKGKDAVWSSRDAFEELMSKIDSEELKVIVEYDNKKKRG